MRARRLVALLFAIAVLAAAAWTARPYVHGLSFVIRAAEAAGTVRRLADLDATATREREIAIPTVRGPLRARLYEPSRPRHRAALLVSGLHPAGIDEPRLVGLARHLSASGLTIVTPDIPELSRFEITPAITDAIEQAGLWLSSDGELAPDRKVGLMGVSFSGGLSVVASGRPSMADRVAFVISFGGHADLPRVLRYLCTGVEPRPMHQLQLPAFATRASARPRPTLDASDASGRGKPETVGDVGVFVRSPHDAGVAVMLLGLGHRLVPPSQVEPLRAAVRRFLAASHLGRVDKPQADRDFESLREAAKRMPEPSATLLRYVNERDVVHLGARLVAFVGSYGGDPSLSPSRSAKPSAPVFLLHGIDDNVIPAVESEYLAEELRGHAPVRLLLSGVISDAEAGRPIHAGEIMKLAGFWGDLLSR
jgi:dienelactone hydrolase